MDRIEAAIQRWADASEADGTAFSNAYDSLCWILITSTGEDLKQFCWKYWASFDKVPTPLIVLTARLLAYQYRDDDEVVEKCKDIIELYCDPIELGWATDGL